MDTRFKVGHPKRYPMDWVFCSRRCQDCFHRLYTAGVRAIEAEGSRPKGGDVIDPTEAERLAMRQCLKPLGEAAIEIGMDRALGSYSEAEALRLIEAVVSTYVEAMVQEHERSKYPPVRMHLDAPR
jgi:hypothetical protein